MPARPELSALSRTPLSSLVTLAPGADVVALLPRRDVTPHPEQLVGCYDHASLSRLIHTLSLWPRINMRRLGYVNGNPVASLRIRDTTCKHRPLRVLVTAGVHGVEPAGPAAALLFMQHLLADPTLHKNLDVTVLPLVNPTGYLRRVRGNQDGIDLNRRFANGPFVPREVAIARRVLKKTPFDLGIDLHASRSVGERGFFALHNNAGDLLRPAMQRFSARHAILRESTDQYRLEAEGVLRSQNNGTLKDYLESQGTRWAMTIEAPAVWPYEKQVIGSAEMVHTLIETAKEFVPKL